MTHREKQNLLDEILNDDSTAPLRDATLRASLRAIRSRRRRRFASYAAVMALPWLIVLYPRHTPPPVPALSENAPPLPHSSVERIDEQQLLALFPNRPLALIGKPGEQKLVFLDRAQASGPTRATQ